MTARRILAVAVVAAAGGGTAIADVTFQTILRSDQAPPQIDPLDGATFCEDCIYPMALGEGGHAVVGAVIVGPSFFDTVEYVGLPGALTKYYRTGDPFPPLPDVFFEGFLPPLSIPNRSGHIAAQVPLSGAGVNSSNDTAIFLWDGSQHTLAMREGDLAPGFNPLLGLTLPNVTLGSPLLLDDGRFVKNELRFDDLFPDATSLYAGTPASPTLVVEPGAPVPGLPGEIWRRAWGIKCTSAGTCFAVMELEGGEMTYWTGNPESLSLLLRESEPVPGLVPDYFPILGGPRAAFDINDAGEALFVVEGSDTRVLFGTAGNFVVVAREGDEVPGLPGVVYDDFTEFSPSTRLASGDDRIGLFARLSGAGVTTANNYAILIGQPGALQVVFRSGDQAPGYPAGHTFGISSSDNNPAFSSAAGYAIRTDVLDDQGVVAGQAMFAGDLVTGEPVLVAGVGSAIEIAPGDVRTVDDGSISQAFGSAEYPLINAQNQLLFTMGFTDGTSAALLATITGATTGPFFELDAAPTVDDTSGNADGLVDPAESGITLTIPIRNIGTGSSTGVSATLTSLTPTATVVGGSSAYSDLAAGASGTNTSTFEIAIDPSHPCGGSVNLQLSIVSSEGSNDFSFVLQGGESYAGCAAFAQAGTAIVDDTAGNGNGFVDPGESIALTVPVAKIDGTGPTTSVMGTLTSLTPTATVTTAAAAYPDLSPDAPANNTTAYIIALDPSHPCGAGVDLSLAVEADGGLASDVLEFTVPTGSAPPILTTVSRAGPSIPIPDNDPVGISVNVEVSGLSDSLGDVDVRFDPLSACSSSNSSLSGGLTHREIGELVITLTSPQGTSVVILNQQGDSNNHLCDAVFDDEANAPFPACIQPHSCSHQPFSPLSAFDGEDPNGTWTLHVADVNPEEDRLGNLQAFSLLLGTTSCETAGDCPADLDGSGAVDVFDLLAYLDLWFAGDAAAERTGDDPASVDVFDLLAYLDSWFAGC